MDQHPSNSILETASDSPRRGRPKGSPKPLGSGRQKGTPNKVGKEAREIAAKYTPKAFQTLAKLLDSDDGKVAALAAQQILDRAFGKPVSPSEIAGPGGTPLIPSPEIDDFALASLITFITTKSGQIERPALKPIVGAVKQADPFADQRADQQRQIA